MEAMRKDSSNVNKDIFSVIIRYNMYLDREDIRSK